MIVGERSNGKTYAVLEYALEQFWQHGKELAIIRRMDEDFKGGRAKKLFNSLVCNGEGVNRVKEITGGVWDDIWYYSGQWYLCRFDKETNKRVRDETPFAHAFAVSTAEHDKGGSVPHVDIIFFDEFLSRNGELPDEFVLFMNTLSTIIRQRDTPEIFMCANTINWDSPYFREMGLRNVKNQKPGTIEVYEYGDSELTVAVEYTLPLGSSKKSNKYFAFDNPKLKMITGGGWEIAIYPHLPKEQRYKFGKSNIVFSFFIEYEGERIQGDVVAVNDVSFIHMHQKTTEFMKPDEDLIYSQKYDPRPNWRRKLTKPVYPIEKKVVDYFIKEKVFYQDNEIGEIINNYLNWCRIN